MSLRITACAAGLLAACGGAADVSPPAPGAPAASGSTSIRAAELRAHVELLASDEYAGRETLQAGARLAATHLARTFESYGLTPMPGQAGFEVDYTLYELGYDAARTQLALINGDARIELTADVDLKPFDFSDEGSIDAELVFAGYGISAPELGYDDYQGLDVAGKVVLVLRHGPNEKAENSSFDATDHTYFATKARVARQQGAAGMILVTDPRHHLDEDDLRLSRILLTQPRAAQPPRDDGGEPRTPFLAAHISQHAAAELIASTGTTLLALQEAVDAGQPASAFSLGAARAALSVHMRDRHREVTARNVAGFLEGSDPALKDEWVVIGAHYDHLGTFRGKGDTVFNGADDNASGTAGMLELAQAFAARPDRPRRSVIFLGFSGEEKGLLGSRALLEQSILPIDKVVFMLNLDMIGRNPADAIAVVGDGYGTGLRAAVEAANAEFALPLELGGSDYSGNSDHDPFYEREVPFLFFFTGIHDDYHQLTDHADKLAYDRMEQIVRVAYGVADEVASGAVTPRFVHHVGWLGIEVQVTEAGAVITAVDGDSRAAEAGLAVDDVIRGFGDAALDDPRTVGKRFREIEPGTRLELAVDRAGHRQRIAVERARTGYLGVVLDMVTDDQRRELGLADDEGLAIRALAEDGPASAAGIREKDILIRVQGRPVGPRTLARQLARIGAGEQVKIVVVRAGERVELELVLAERPERRPRP